MWSFTFIFLLGVASNFQSIYRILIKSARWASDMVASKDLQLQRHRFMHRYYTISAGNPRTPSLAPPESAHSSSQRRRDTRAARPHTLDTGPRIFNSIPRWNALELGAAAVIFNGSVTAKCDEPSGALTQMSDRCSLRWIHISVQQLVVYRRSGFWIRWEWGNRNKVRRRAAT